MFVKLQEKIDFAFTQGCEIVHERVSPSGSFKTVVMKSDDYVTVFQSQVYGDYEDVYWTVLSSEELEVLKKIELKDFRDKPKRKVPICPKCEGKESPNSVERISETTWKCFECFTEFQDSLRKLSKAFKVDGE
ncbi:hypothetical protein P9302_16070 [Brevibacillus agri]|uniref:hypothetical protein n=1 Tax=Brevibacillus agri TaxID=51101 RepID=UPI002E1CDE2C|nr:hypothetical protein [Brevibacillus agri]